MEPKEILENYSKSVERWLIELSAFDARNFYQPGKSGWSVSEVVDHICKTTDKCLELALRCSEGKGEKDRSGLGAAVFSWMGSFPPVKIRMKNPPDEVKAIYNPEKPDAEMAANLLRASVVKMKEALDRVKSADDNVRLKHWAGGWFNAKQWYHSAEMHIRHHFRQLERIKKHLSIK